MIVLWEGPNGVVAFMANDRNFGHFTANGW